MFAACNVCFLKTITYIEAQKYPFGTNGLNKRLREKRFANRRAHLADDVSLCHVQHHGVEGPCPERVRLPVHGHGHVGLHQGVLDRGRKEGRKRDGFYLKDKLSLALPF